eukprot:gene19617-biopygen20540
MIRMASGSSLAFNKACYVLQDGGGGTPLWPAGGMHPMDPVLNPSGWGGIPAARPAKLVRQKVKAPHSPWTRDPSGARTADRCSLPLGETAADADRTRYFKRNGRGPDAGVIISPTGVQGGRAARRVGWARAREHAHGR